MAVQQGVWGVDVGQCSLKAIRLEVIDGAVTATAFDTIDHPKILSQPDADPDQLIREALETFLSRNNLKGDQVAMAVPGQSGLARFVKLPPVQENKIGEIVKFEAKQQIPFPLDEVVWDYQKLGAGEVAGGFAMETEIGLFAMKRELIARQLQHFSDVGVEVHVIQMVPLALCNYVSYDWLAKGGLNAPAEEEPADDVPKNKRRCAVALDIGADSSNLVVTDGIKVIWQRPLPLGGNHMTRALSKEMKITFAKAEHLKRNAAKSPELKTILTALKPVLNDFASEVQRSLGFFTTSHRDAHVLYMVGLGNALKLPGFQKFLSEKLGLEIKRPTKLNRLGGSDEVLLAPNFAENLLSFAPAYGLALQGLNQTLLHTNLLPGEIRVDRMIRAKKPWAVTAAASILLGTCALAGGYAMSLAQVTAKPVQDAMKKADDVIKDVQKSNNDANAKTADVQATADELKRIIFGKDEQINWLRLNAYVNRCLPRPDGSNLRADGSVERKGGYPNEKVPNQAPYWRTQAADEAVRQFNERMKGSQAADVPMPDEVRENLAQVEIEAFDTVFCPNLKAFYDAAAEETEKRQGRKFDAMLKYDLDNPPKDTDQGWVVALRGSTFHKDGRNFLADCVIYNLATFCDRKFAPPADAAAGAAANPPAAAAKPAEIDSVTDRVTHVFLFNAWPVPDPKPGVYTHINNSVLRDLVKGGGTDPNTPPPASGRGERGGGDGGGAGAAGGTPTFESWLPLTSSGTGQGGSSGRGGDGGRTGPASDATATAPPAGRGKPKPRYEFIAVFVWREPTPSDALLKPTDPNAPR